MTTKTRVFVTGATGFIGSHVVRLLLHEGCNVFALVRPNSNMERIADIANEIEIIEGDISAAASLQTPLHSWAPDVCLHLAWYTESGECLQSPKNLTCFIGSVDLLEVLSKAKCPRIVVAGTGIEYDTDTGYVAEDSPIKPRSLYAACKHSLFLTAEQLTRERGQSLAVPRIFNVYGPWEDDRRMVPLVIRKLLTNEPCDLTIGTQVRDYLHVEDVASAIWVIAKSGLEGPVNIGSEQPMSVASIAREIGRLLNRSDLLRIGGLPSREGDPPILCANSQRLRTNTEWRPRYDLQEGLQHTINWWSTHGPTAA